MKFKALPVTSLEDATIDFEQLQGILPSTVTALPSSAADGQTIEVVVDATNGIVWRFRYRAASASTHRWEFIGGPALEAQVDTAETTTSVTYAALATAGPVVTLPFAGDYDIGLGAYMRNSTATASVFMSYDIGGVGAIDGNAIQFDAAAVSLGNHVYRGRRFTNFSAVALTAKYRTSGGTALFGSRYLSATPVRVG